VADCRSGNLGVASLPGRVPLLYRFPILLESEVVVVRCGLASFCLEGHGRIKIPEGHGYGKKGSGFNAGLGRRVWPFQDGKRKFGIRGAPRAICQSVRSANEEFITSGI